MIEYIETLKLAFYFTWPLWAFLGILLGALVVEEGIDHYRSRVIDNPTLW
jgi:predicted branched-subunit amino acid permease